MPRNNGAAARERRRLEAVARSGVVTVEPAPAWLPVLSREELAAVNAAAAAEKASHPEGLGHADPELTEAGLVRLMHVSRWVRDKRGRFVERTDGKTCPIATGCCLECAGEATEEAAAALSHRIFAANAGLRMVRAAEAKRAGLPPRKPNPHERPDVGFALKDRT